MPRMDPAIIEALIHSGGIVTMAAIFFALYREKDKKLQEETRARIEDAEKTLDLVMKIQDKTNENVQSVGKLVEELRRQRQAS
jgi:RNA polymerase-interacting CarD/CdnL/TRCF family regulator